MTSSHAQKCVCVCRKSLNINIISEKHHSEVQTSHIWSPYCWTKHIICAYNTQANVSILAFTAARRAFTENNQMWRKKTFHSPLGEKQVKVYLVEKQTEKRWQRALRIIQRKGDAVSGKIRRFINLRRQCTFTSVTLRWRQKSRRRTAHNLDE